VRPSPEVRWLFTRLKRYRPALALLFVFFLIGSALGLASPLVVRHLVDRVFTGQDRGALAAAIGLLLGLNLVQIVLSEFATYRYSRLAGRLVLDLRSELFRHLERVPIDFYTHRRVGDLASRIGGDIAEVQASATGSVLALTTAVVTLVVTIVILVLLDPVLLGVALLSIPVSVLLARRFGGPTRVRARLIREENATLGSTLFESLLGQHFVRSHGLETRTARRFYRDGRRIYGAALSLARLSAWSSGLTSFTSAITSSAILGVGGLRIFQGELTLGSLLAFQLYVNGLHGPVQGLVGLYLRLQRAQASLARLREILDVRRDPPGRRAVPERLESLEFTGVSFAYEGGPPVLRDVSFRLRTGERVAVVGPSGRGKSTLLDLALGLRRPSTGSVLIAGHPIESYRAEALHARIGVVAQDTFLFHATVRENLLLVDPRSSEGAIWDALERVELRAFVEGLPQGLDTSVGERALRLSGGQKQRLALARAILRRPKLLVLDEATSALDELTDAQIQRALEPIFRECMTLVASHRQSLVASADRAILIEDGSVNFEGAPGEVLARAHGVR
jgi:ATP-binding cassette subfamily B protein